MKRSWADLIAVGILLLIYTVFFAHIFYPQPKLLVTPDYGRSDAWHFSFPTKYALSEALQRGTLPIWRSDIGAGFPLYAEGQTGALYLPNVIYFWFFSPVIAYNLALVTAVVILGVGTYALIRQMGQSAIAGFFAGVTLSFSALTITQLPHISLLQGISMLPVIAFLSLYAIQQRKSVWFGVVAVMLAQQIYAGFPQATFLTLVFTGILVLRTLLPYKDFRGIVGWGIAILLGIGMGAFQLIPSYEFLSASTDPHGFSPQVANAYSMPLKHLISFIDPFFFGSPADGTYPPFYRFDGSIFWENTAYIGLLPIILLIGGIFLIKRHRSLIFWYVLLLVTVALAAGKYAPTYVIYSMWPMTLFRVASRFLWLTVFIIVIISSYTLDVLRQRSTLQNSVRILLTFLLAAHILQITGTWRTYHQFVAATDVLKPPDTMRTLVPGRVMTIGEGKVHNDEMLGNGWQDPDHYAFLRNGISPLSNVVWHIPHAEIYAGRFLKRPSITEGLLSDSFAMSPSIATVSSTTMLSVFHVANVLSFVPLDAPMLTQATSYEHGMVSLRQYRNNEVLPRAYLVSQAQSAATLVEAVSLLRKRDGIPGQTVLLEEHSVNNYPAFRRFLTHQPKNNITEGTIAWNEDNQTVLRLSVTTATDALLVLADTYYPGWRASVDGTETPIIPANLSQRAIIVPKGSHDVSFRYEPESLTVGGIVSGIFLVITVYLTVVPLPVFVSRTQKKSRLPVSYHPNIRRTRRIPS